MSPTEEDLRAALQDGEGDAADAVDAGQVIARGMARRVQRRNRLLGGSAAVVFVAALATGGTLLVRNGNDDTSTKGSQPQDRAVASKRESMGPSGIPPGNGSHPGTPATGVTCPSPPSHQLLPGGGSPGQFGSGGRLFPKPVTTLIACGYTTGAGVETNKPGQTALSGADARLVVTSLENAAKRPPDGNCPDYQLADHRTLVFIAVAGDGSIERPVTATLTGPTCHTQVTNGTAVRYAWTPSTSVAASLQALLPTTGNHAPGIDQPGGGNQKNGSPVR